MVEGKSFDEIRMEQTKAFEELSIEDHMTRYESQGMDKKEAMRMVAKDRGISKREVYQYLLNREI